MHTTKNVFNPHSLIFTLFQLTLRFTLLAGLCSAIASCQKKGGHEWEIVEIVTQKTAFNGGKIYLPPADDSSNIELEIARNRCGISFCVNLLLFQAPPWREDPSRTTLLITLEGQEPWEVHPLLLAGGQKIELCDEIANILIETLLEGQSFRLKVGRNEIQVPSTHFAKKYQKLLEIPIDLNEGSCIMRFV